MQVQFVGESLPEFVFLDAPFSLQLALLDDKGDLLTNRALPISVGVVPASLGVVLVSKDSVPWKISPDGVARLNLMLTGPESLLGSKIQLKASVGELECTSHSMRLVKFGLVVCHQPPKVWYKDEGGKDNAMLIRIMLCNALGLPEENVVVPLKLVLLYDSEGFPAADDELWTFLEDSPRPVIERNARCDLKIRIKQVSKNHQNRNFLFRVLVPSGHSLSFCIAPCLTSSVNVRSKRNKIRNSFDHRKQEVSAKGIGISQSSKFGDVLADASSNSLLQQWFKNVLQCMRSIEWEKISEEHFGDRIVSTVSRCPACWVYRDSAQRQNHSKDCFVSNDSQQFLK